MVNVTATDGTYDSADVDKAATVTYTGLALDNSNYTLGSQIPLTGGGRIRSADKIKPEPIDQGNTASTEFQSAMASVEQLYSGTTARQAQGLGSVLPLPNFTIYLNETGSLWVLGGGIALPSSVQMIGVDLSPQTFQEGRLEDTSRTGQKSTDRMENDEAVVK